MEELLTEGDLLPHIKVLYQIKAIITYNTAMCERGFSRMKLIKDALRNRMYVETLNALMMIALVGPSYVEYGDDGFFEEAIKIWESNVQRNPKKLDSATRMLRSAVHTRAKLSCQPKQTWAVTMKT